jgi:predicted small metal-binding protein
VVWLHGRLVLRRADGEDSAVCVCGWHEQCESLRALLEVVDSHLRYVHGVAAGEEAIWEHDP